MQIDGAGPAHAARWRRRRRSAGGCRRTGASRSASSRSTTSRLVKNAHGCTVNDVIVSICAGAVRRWLIAHDELPDDPLVAQIPISVRTEEQIGTYGNRIMLMAAPLHTEIADPVARLRADARVARRHEAAPPRAARLPADRRQPLHPAGGLLARRAADVRHRHGPGRPVWNLVISNVPGPQFPLYLAGARLVANYPVSVITHGMGLNITVMSYMGHLDFGIVRPDREQMPLSMSPAAARRWPAPAVYAWHCDRGRPLLDVRHRRPELPARRAGERQRRQGHVQEHLPRRLLRALAAHPLRGLREPRRGDVRRHEAEDLADRAARGRLQARLCHRRLRAERAQPRADVAGHRHGLQRRLRERARHDVGRRQARDRGDAQGRRWGAHSYASAFSTSSRAARRAGHSDATIPASAAARHEQHERRHAGTSAGSPRPPADG